MSHSIPSVFSLLLASLLLAVSPAQEAVTSSPASQPATTQKFQPATTQPIRPIKLKKLVLDLGKGVKMELVLIPAGKFMMGSPENEEGRANTEGPQHLVTIAKPFYMGIYPVTQEQFQAVMGKNLSEFKEESSHPVDSVTWEDCQEFCKKLSGKTGRKVRLPSEAEWEYACRAGSTTRFYYGDDPDYSQLPEYAWINPLFDNSYQSISRSKTHPVGLKKPNVWGLYDMHGNVRELCQDWFHSFYTGAPTDGSAWISIPNNYLSTPIPSLASNNTAWENKGYHHVLRGASSHNFNMLCRSAARGESYVPDDYGFRIVVQAAGE